MQRLSDGSYASRPASESSEDLGGIALFFDVENILIGIQGDFDVHAVTRFLSERGEVMILKAYADWGRYRRQQRAFLEEGVQMVFLPTYGASDKNRTDTAICVDAMEILYTRPRIDTFCIVSGDSDFGILAQRLRDHGKRVIGVSARTAASPILVKQCHEFVYYETLIGLRVAGFSVEEGEGRLKRGLERIVEEVGPEFRASVLKDRLRKQDSTFSERNYGAASFTRFLANYDHLVTLLDGGLVRLTGEGQGLGNTVEKARGAPKPPTLTPERVANARAVLLRTVLEAAKRHGKLAVPLSRLKDTMQAVAPDFDEVALGYKTFTQFLMAFPDIVMVDRPSNSARPNEGIVPDGVDMPEGDASPANPERRRRAKKAPLPSAQEADAALANSAAEAKEAHEPREVTKEPKEVVAKEPKEVREPKEVKEPREPRARVESPRSPELPLLAGPDMRALDGDA